jgi:hypothetical protein
MSAIPHTSTRSPFFRSALRQAQDGARDATHDFDSKKQKGALLLILLPLTHHKGLFAGIPTRRGYFSGVAATLSTTTK